MRALWQIFRQVGPYVLAAALVAWGVTWVVGHWEQIRATLTLSPWHMAALVPLTIISTLVTGWTNQMLAAHLGAVLTFRQWASLSFASTLMNYILPLRAGMALRAGYFKRRHNFPLSLFTSTFLVASLMTLLANATIGLGALGWTWATRGLFSWATLAVFAAVVLGCLALLYLAPRSKGDVDRKGFAGALVRIHQGSDSLRHSHRLMGRLAAQCVLTSFLYSFRMQIAFAAVGHTVGFAGCLLIGALVSVSMFISLTPGSLGIREAAILFASLAVGVPPEASLMAGALDRLASVLVLAVAGPYGIWFISRDVPPAD